MIKLIFKLFVLLTLTAAAGLSSETQAQQSPALTGEWVGNTHPPGRSEFVRFSLTENAGELRFPLARVTMKLSLVRREGDRVRFELDSLKLVMTGTIAGDEIDGEAEVPGIKAHFHLTRTTKVKPEILAGYVGAYRFRNGDYLLIDRFADYLPDTLHAIDVKSGEVRAIFPRPEIEFISGPALYVTSPTEQTITFRGNGTQAGANIKSESPAVAGGSRRIRPRANKGAFATRIPIRQEEVTFKNGDVTLAGTLLTPTDSEQWAVGSEQQGSRRTRVAKTKDLRPRPAIVFTHGGGPQLREMFWGLGYLYAARGFVVLSYDKRGAGKSTGNWRDASFQDLADDAVAAAKFLQSRTDINPKQIGFWGLSQGGWIAPLAASRFPDAAFAIALSGGGLTPAETELFDTEYELSKAGYTKEEINDALTWQRLKNEIIASPNSDNKWEQYTKLRLKAKDAKWFRQQGVDIFGPERRDDPFWTFMRRFYLYDPGPTLRSMHAPLLAIFGGLDTPEGVEAEVSAIKRIMDQAGRRGTSSSPRGDSSSSLRRDSSRTVGLGDYMIKVYPNSVHNLMKAPPDNPNEYVRLKRFPPGFFETMVDWTTRQLRGRARGRR
ncbi:MAG TPA: alpha/beta fold hydrolase [Pyrinomonadaceae bacterium]|nr:alpha/beta fold hydrolase [Pyrinomonadaceae bacterium]